ncbi:cell division protein FtsQ/DivIB [Rubellicoccus peritrichatus]|uniref:FtsQ-type POTRA domain-containing protein n=1 Tax=Rubellicoccus peritrichatus TaxID=3080537 RepID=A0AAQ3LDM8_9BACT|nr:FtsQ-type POTRA domain-containing protein [Puniceicoccus sp. CR14]WOO43556.1 FtsQ-type POTRA domain-containing protein [Puniceicoccus sp. CR14]
MAKNTKKSSPDSSWRNIKQSSARRAVTSIAKKRRLHINLRYCGYAFGFLLMVAFAVGAVWWWQHRAFGALAVPEETLSQVYFESDGVLNEKWFEESIDIPSGVSLMDVDIFALRDDIMDYGQVKQATVERIFPNALRVTIEEHNPILRIAIMDAKGQRFLYLISEEGQVFDGQNYPKATIRGLPFLDGVILKRNDEGFQPVVQAPVLSEFLYVARAGWPQLYADWRVVSCRDFKGDPSELGALIHVRSDKHGDLVFSPKNFPQQLQRLSEISDYAKREQLSGLASVDLSLQEPAVRLSARDIRQGPHASRR